MEKVHMSYNRLYNATNPYQGKFKRILCVCSAGLLRSPTAALVLSQEPYNLNTRAAGLDKGHALILVDEILLHWANGIVCMTEDQEVSLKKLTKKPVMCLKIEDSYAYRDPKLIELIETQYNKLSTKWRV